MFKTTAQLCAMASAILVLLASCEKPPGYVYPYKPPKPLPEAETPPVGYRWNELPEPPAPSALVSGGGDGMVISHRETFGGKRTRNYTMLYDTREKVSYWVAYPLHSVFIGSGAKRADKYMYDIDVSESLQSSAASSRDGSGNYIPYSGGYGGGWQRGHQIPAADRNTTQTANDQTFYMTNMTPQNGSLNGGVWADLESWVRSRALDSNGRSRFDTLYVVTGCWLGGSPSHLSSRNNVAIPEAYYKVLLRTRTGKRGFPNEDDHQCIGFWYENSPTSSTYKNHVNSVGEIEDMLGGEFDFFPVLSEEAKEHYDRSDWTGLAN